jgi:8-oxo-dGTP diphosphatase
LPQSALDAGKEYKNPIPTVDIILRNPSDEREILLEIRGQDPFKGKYALPGGHVDYGETVESAVLRELMEECGVRARLVGIFGVYSDPKRDPRGQRISTVFLGDYQGGKVRGADDAKSASWVSLEVILRKKSRIAFDHHLILRDYNKFLLTRKSFDETFWSTKRREQ